MDFSPEERELAAKQVASKQGYGIKGLFECAVNSQCQLNAAVELLRLAERGLEVAGYSPSSITDFLSKVREEANDDQ